jgi:hypothetical protein
LIVFQEKYGVFRHLIEDNKYENNKINKQHRQVPISWLFFSFYITKNRNFQGKIIKLWLLYLYFLFRWWQIPPGHLQIKFAALYIVKTQQLLIALIL